MAWSAVSRRALAVIGVMTLGLGSMTLTGSATATQTAAETRSDSSTAAARPAPDPDYAMPKVPVWVNIGDRGLGGVTVSVLGAEGMVRATARTNDAGVALIPRTFLRGKHALTVTGGRAWERLGSPTLSTGELIRDRNAVIIISPLTSIAHRVAKLTGTSYDSALLRTRKAHGIAPHVDHLHAAATDLVFHTGQLKKWSKKHGGLHAGMDRLAKLIAKGKPVPAFRPTATRQARSETSTALWVGEQIMSGVLSGSGSKGASIVIGDLFGASDPTTAELASINSELAKVVTELAAIEQTLQELVYLMEQTSFQVLNAGMADLAGAVNGNDTSTGLWAVYLSATTLDPTSPSYEADISGFAASFYNGVYSILPSEVGELFDTPTSPGLLHQIYNFNTAPWWNSDDIASISSIIDYYGTIQAQAVTLVNEAWWSPNPAYSQTPDDINIYNTSNYGPQNADIYLSMPTQITDSQIGVPGNQTVYQAFPLSVTHVYEQRSGDYYPLLPSCSDNGEALTRVLAWPPIESSTSVWASTWASAMSSNWTSQSSSALDTLKVTRMLPNSSGTSVATYPLPALASGAPGAYLLAANGLLPGAGYNAVNDGHPEPILQQWMWCQDSAVSLLDTTKWVTNFVMGTDGTNVPPSAPSDWAEQAIPVGVLGGQSGSFRYVAPSASS